MRYMSTCVVDAFTPVHDAPSFGSDHVLIAGGFGSAADVG